ncbi:uncharacterized protein LOC124487259 [Hypomesus transpacificus]|uniref:uncharacterized protein LOC124487259 n=1 Tax=Hypomesus transpacificus TaxID=137520 RepID=UPI001F07EEED|nr:uncharacterized protein LOC124487259 [Hypomesus transpacificus]
MKVLILFSSVSPESWSLVPITTAVAASAPAPGLSLLGARRQNPSSSLLVRAAAVATTPAAGSSLLGTWGLAPLNAAPSTRAADTTTAAPQLELYTRHEHNGHQHIETVQVDCYPCHGWKKYSARIICAKDDYFEARRKMKEYLNSDTAGLQSEDTSTQVLPNGRNGLQFSCPTDAPGYQDMQGFIVANQQDYCDYSRTYTNLTTSSRPSQFPGLNNVPPGTSPLPLPCRRNILQVSSPTCSLENLVHDPPMLTALRTK